MVVALIGGLAIPMGMDKSFDPYFRLRISNGLCPRGREPGHVCRLAQKTV